MHICMTAVRTPLAWKSGESLLIIGISLTPVTVPRNTLSKKLQSRKLREGTGKGNEGGAGTETGFDKKHAIRSGPGRFREG